MTCVIDLKRYSVHAFMDGYTGIGSFINFSYGNPLFNNGVSSYRQGISPATG